MRLSQYLARYSNRRLGLSPAAAVQIEISVRLFSRWLGRPSTLSDLTGDRLLAWPRGRRKIWPKFKEILRSADLPCERRDLFHRLRRTSYSYVYAALGVKAASAHASHTSDLSNIYLDTRLLPTINAVDVLPRP